MPDTTGGGERVHGPYKHRRRWRIIIVSPGGQRDPRSYPSRGEAEAVARALRAEVATEGSTVSAAIEQYLTHQRRRGNADASIATTGHRLRALLEPVAHLPPWQLTTARCERAYEARADAVRGDTHRGELGQARTFGRWLMRRGLARRNPWAEVEPLGARAAGKPQLTVDEARKLVAHCHARAGEDLAAVAVLIGVYFGVRSSEILALTGRDLDDDGAVLRVSRRKKRRAVTDALEVPEPLRPVLRALGEGAWFEGRTRDWLHYHCLRLCRAAGVPKVTPHALRGTLASGLREHGVPAEVIAQLLAHDSVRVTETHYIDAGAAARAEQRGRLRVLRGGRR